MYAVDLGRKLVAASGHGTDQIAIRTECGTQRRNLPLEIIFLDDPVGPHARHQRILGNHCAARLDQRHQHVESATAELDRSAAGEQLTAMRPQEETPERDARRCFGSDMHRSNYRAVTENHRFFSGRAAGKPARGAHRISQLYKARSKGLYRRCSLTLGALGEAEPHRGAIRQRRCSPASVNLPRESHHAAEYSSDVFSSASKPGAPRRKLVTPGNRRRRRSRIRPFPRPLATAAAACRRRSGRTRHARLRSPHGPSGSRWRARHERRAHRPGVAKRRSIGRELEVSSLGIAQSAGRGPRSHPYGVRPRLPIHRRTARE